MAKTTPGPWTALGGGLSIGVYVAFEKDTPIGAPVHIASCWHSERVPAIDGYANARLIAAAPDLLAALKFYVGAGTERERDRAQEIAETAIAKAGGR